MHDVIVIGAGPSGLNAAKILMKKGLDVLVLEKKSEVGEHVICAGIVGHEAFQKFALSKESILREIRQIKVVSPHSNTLDYEHPDPFAYVVDRGKFDRGIARDLGAENFRIRCNSRVNDIVVKEDSVEVNTEVIRLTVSCHYNYRTTISPTPSIASVAGIHLPRG